MHIGQYVFAQIASFLPKRYFERLDADDGYHQYQLRRPQLATER